MASPPEPTLDRDHRARAPTPYPSPNAGSPLLFRAASFGSSGSDELVEVPVSSSPPTSSPGAILTPPQDLLLKTHDHRIEEPTTSLDQTSNDSLCDIDNIDANSAFLKEKASGATLYSDSPGLQSSDPRHPEHLTDEDEGEEHSSGRTSWIEDYIEPESGSSDAAAAEAEFTRVLSAKLIRILEQRSRIQALSSGEEISPYSKDLRARAAGLPTSGFDEPTPKILSQSSPCPAQHDILESPKAQSNSTGNAQSVVTSGSANKENAPFSPASGPSVFFDTLSVTVDDQQLRTPDPDKSPVIPSAPRKVLRQMRISGPREQPPPLTLPSLTLEAPLPGDSHASITDVFMSGSSDNPTSGISGAYSQVSGMKRPLLEHTEETKPKRRKMSVRRSQSGHNKVAVLDANGPQDILATLLNPGKFATRRASLRKAVSLRSESSATDAPSPDVSSRLHRIPNADRQRLQASVKAEPDTEPSLPTPHLSPIEEFESFGHIDSIQPSFVYPATQPATPIPTNARVQFQARLKAQLRSPDSLPYPLPILAPPPYVEIPRAPTNEEVAEARLAMMINKEQEERKEDGFLSAGLPDNCTGSQHLSKEDTPNSEMDELENDPDKDEEMQVRNAVCGGDNKGRGDSVVSVDEAGMGCEDDVFDWPIQHQICIDEDFRQEVVEWILDVSRLFRPPVLADWNCLWKTLPPEFRSKPTVGKHLRDQLTTSPDTRWHATQLFNRYIIRTGSSPPSSPRLLYGELTEGQKVSSQDERAGFVWDIALACIALSVKVRNNITSSHMAVANSPTLLVSSRCLEPVLPGFI